MFMKNEKEKKQMTELNMTILRENHKFVIVLCTYT